MESPLTIGEFDSNINKQSDTFAFQAGGHGVSNEKDGLLLSDDYPDSVLKVLPPKLKGFIEILYYSDVSTALNESWIDNMSDDDVQSLRKYYEVCYNVNHNEDTDIEGTCGLGHSVCCGCSVSKGDKKSVSVDETFLSGRTKLCEWHSSNVTLYRLMHLYEGTTAFEEIEDTKARRLYTGKKTKEKKKEKKKKDREKEVTTETTEEGDEKEKYEDIKTLACTPIRNTDMEEETENYSSLLCSSSHNVSSLPDQSLPRNTDMEEETENNNQSLPNPPPSVINSVDHTNQYNIDKTLNSMTDNTVDKTYTDNTPIFTPPNYLSPQLESILPQSYSENLQTLSINTRLALSASASSVPPQEEDISVHPLSALHPSQTPLHSRYLESLRALSPFLSTSLGVCARQGVISNKMKFCLILQNLTHKYTHPTVCDIKIGQRTWNPFANVKKITTEFKKYSKQPYFGFRFIGAKVFQTTASSLSEFSEGDSTGNNLFNSNSENLDEWRGSSGHYTDYDKMAGREIVTRDDVVRMIHNVIFPHSASSSEVALISKDECLSVLFRVLSLLLQLTAIVRVLINYPSHHYYSSSLLITYESDPNLHSLPRKPVNDIESVSDISTDGLLSELNALLVSSARGETSSLDWENQVMEILERYMPELSSSVSPKPVHFPLDASQLSVHLIDFAHAIPTPTALVTLLAQSGVQGAVLNHLHNQSANDSYHQLSNGTCHNPKSQYLHINDTNFSSMSRNTLVNCEKCRLSSSDSFPLPLPPLFNAMPWALGNTVPHACDDHIDLAMDAWRSSVRGAEVMYDTFGVDSIHTVNLAGGSDVKTGSGQFTPIKYISVLPQIDGNHGKNCMENYLGLDYDYNYVNGLTSFISYVRYYIRHFPLFNKKSFI